MRLNNNSSIVPYLSYTLDYNFNDNLVSVTTSHKELSILNLTVLIFQYFTDNIYVDYFYAGNVVEYAHELYMSGLYYQYFDMFLASLDVTELDDYRAVFGIKLKQLEESQATSDTDTDTDTSTDYISVDESSKVAIDVDSLTSLNSLDVEGDYNMYTCEDAEVFDGYHANYDINLRYDSIPYKRSLRRFRELHYLRSLRIVLERMSHCFCKRLTHQKNLAYIFCKKEYYLSNRFLFFNERRDFLFKIILQNLYNNCFSFFFLFKNSLTANIRADLQLQLKNRLYCDLSGLDVKHGDLGKIFDNICALYCLDFFRKESKYRLRIKPIACVQNGVLSLFGTVTSFDYCLEYLNILEDCSAGFFSHLVELYRIFYLLLLYELVS